MTRSLPMTDELREIMYEIADLEPEDLALLRETLKEHARDLAPDRRAEVEERVRDLIGAEADRAAPAFEALTDETL